MTTPEGKIKTKVRALLAEYKNVYCFQPVQTGFGAAGLDFHCAAAWGSILVAFFIETKAPGETTTPRQDVLIAKLKLLNAKVFVIDGDAGLRRLETWLDKLQLPVTNCLPS